MAFHPTRRHLLQAGSALAAGAALASNARAQGDWPARPIRIVVPYTAGGFTDQMARLLQVGLQQRLGQPVVVDNKPGANGIIGVDAVAKAAPDGYTFGVFIAVGIWWLASARNWFKGPRRTIEEIDAEIGAPPALSESP